MFVAGRKLSLACKHQLLTRSIFNQATIGKFNSVVNYQSILTTDHASQLRPYFQPARNIFGLSHLALEKLEQIQENKLSLISSNKERYIERLKQFIEKNETSNILRDDLINMIALSENEEHLDILEKIAKEKRAENAIATDTWGATVARVYFKLNLIDRLVERIKDDSFGNFFRQLTTFKIAFTMLYNAGRYQEVVDLYFQFHHVWDKPRRDPMLFIFYASLAKINTPESLQQARDMLLKENQDAHFRNRAFVAYLALNQNETAYALDIIAETRANTHITLHTIKLLCLLKLERYEDLLMQLQRTLSRSEDSKQTVLNEICELIASQSESIEDGELRKEILSTIEELKASKKVTQDTLESLVFRQLERHPDRLYDRAFERRSNHYDDGNERRPYRGDRFSRDDGLDFNRRGGDLPYRGSDAPGRIRNDGFRQRNNFGGGLKRENFGSSSRRENFGSEFNNDRGDFGRKRDNRSRFGNEGVRNYFSNQDESGTADFDRSDSTFSNDSGLKRGFPKSREERRARYNPRNDDFSDDEFESKNGDPSFKRY